MAVIDNGTVSRAATMLNMSQPAMSKLIAFLEDDTELSLFDRVKGRLVPTEQALLFYEEAERILGGVQQLENAVDAIHRQKQDRISVGVLPALADSYIHAATSNFLNRQPNVFCSVQSRSSHLIVEWLTARKLDVGLVGSATASPFVVHEPIMKRPMLCIMPIGHPLSDREVVTPSDIETTPFISFNNDSFIVHQFTEMFERYNIKPNVVLTSNSASIICKYVANGLGISLMHPFVAHGLMDKLVLKRFEPAVHDSFQLCRRKDTRNVQLVDTFVECIHRTELEISASLEKALN